MAKTHTAYLRDGIVVPEPLVEPHTADHAYSLELAGPI
jgi:hypothetical protein